MTASNNNLQSLNINGEAYVGQLEANSGISVVWPYRGWKIDVGMQHNSLGGATDIKVVNPDNIEVDLSELLGGFTRATLDNLRLVMCQIDSIMNVIVN